MSQVLELGRPTVLALNMIDVAEGADRDHGRTRAAIEDSSRADAGADKQRGLVDLKEGLERVIDQQACRRRIRFPNRFATKWCRWMRC